MHCREAAFQGPGLWLTSTSPGSGKVGRPCSPLGCLVWHSSCSCCCAMPPNSCLVPGCPEMLQEGWLGTIPVLGQIDSCLGNPSGLLPLPLISFFIPISPSLCLPPHTYLFVPQDIHSSLSSVFQHSPNIAREVSQPALLFSLYLYLFIRLLSFLF